MPQKSLESKIRHAVGIDISDGSIEIVNLEQNRDNIHIKHHGRISIPKDTIVHGIIKNKQILRQAIRQLLTEINVDIDKLQVFTALPDAQVIAQHFVIKTSKQYSYHELDLIAQEYMTKLHSFDNPKIIWYTKPTKERQIEFFAFATNKHYILEWRSFFQNENMKLIGIEMESCALIRALIRNHKATMITGILDFGYRSTNYTVCNKNGLLFSHSIAQGGETITEALMQQHNLDPVAAEQLKNSGTVQSLTIVSDIVDTWLSEIKRTMSRHPSLHSLIITGGGSALSGISRQIRKTFQVPVSYGRLWIQPDLQKNIFLQSAVLSERDQQLFAGAVGLALRGLNRVTLSKGLNFIDSH